VRARAAAVGLVLALLIGAPALAQRTAGARVDAPAEGSVLTGTVEVRAAGESVAGVKRVEILVNSWSVAVKEPDDFARQVHAGYSWDTTRWVSDGSPAPNGNHTITVQVTSLDGDTDKASVGVLVDNAPQVPAGLEARADGSRVTVSWEPNPEPDVLGYVVERDEGSGFVEIGTSTAAKVSQNLVPGGYSYRVTAVRSSPSSEDGISSDPSPAVDVKVAASAAGGTGAVTDLGRGGGLRGGRGGLGGDAGSGLGALLSNSTLPGRRGLPPIPSPPGIPWGDYEEKLPYGKDAVPPPGSSALTSARRQGGGTLLPADGLRWVAAGLLLMTCAGLALVTAARDVAALARDRAARQPNG
jgi:hypothetical protein